MSEAQPSSGRGLSLLAIVFGVLSAISCLGLVSLVAAGWFLNKSLDAMVDQMLSDTGFLFATEYPEDMPEPTEEGDFEEVQFADEEE